MMFHDVLFIIFMIFSGRYNIDGAELSSQEKIELASKAKVINPAATRLNENPFKEPPVPTSQSQQLFKGVPGKCAHLWNPEFQSYRFIV